MVLTWSVLLKHKFALGLLHGVLNDTRLVTLNTTQPLLFILRFIQF